MIRTIRPPDLEKVYQIEQRVQPNPWKVGMFQDCLDMGYHSYLIEEQGDIQGYGILSSAVQESHILNLCVDIACQRRGLGQKLLSFLLGKAREDGSEIVFLEVRCSNSVALQLYRKFGFNEIGTRKNYYTLGPYSTESCQREPCNRREDAIVMAKTLLFDGLSHLYEPSTSQIS